MAEQLASINEEKIAIETQARAQLASLTGEKNLIDVQLTESWRKLRCLHGSKEEVSAQLADSEAALAEANGENSKACASANWAQH